MSTPTSVTRDPEAKDHDQLVVTISGLSQQSGLAA